MSWKPETHKVKCSLCGEEVIVDFLSLQDIFAENAFVLKSLPCIDLDENREEIKVDMNLLCERCRNEFKLDFTPEPAEKEEFIARELDLRWAGRQMPSFYVRNDSSRFFIRIWADKNVPGIGRDIRIAPLAQAYITGCWISWLQFVTHTDPVATLITTKSPFIVDVYFWDASANQMAPGYPKTLWPQFTDGPHERSFAMDVSDRLMFVFTPYAVKLIQEGIVTLEELPKLSLEEANRRLGEKKLW